MPVSALSMPELAQSAALSEGSRLACDLPVSS